MTIETTVSPAAEPLSVLDAKAFLNLTSDDDDAMLGMLIAAAREWAEKTTGLALVSRTVKEYWDTWPAEQWELGMAPVSSVTSIQYKDTSGTTQTWAASNYATDLVSKPARIYPRDAVAYPELGDYPNAVWATYVAGNASPAAVPADAKAAMLQRIAFLYENREDIPIGGIDAAYRVRSADNLLFNNRLHLI